MMLRFRLGLDQMLTGYYGLEEGKIRFKVAWFNMAYQFQLGTGFTKIVSPR